VSAETGLNDQKILRKTSCLRLMDRGSNTVGEGEGSVAHVNQLIIARMLIANKNVTSTADEAPVGVGCGHARHDTWGKGGWGVGGLGGY
jgi:hypothetical protein